MKLIIRTVAKLVGKIHSPWTHKKITSADYLSLQRILLPGDIILTRTMGELTNLLIPGFWKHSAIVSLSQSVIEAVGTGVQLTHLFDFVKGKDYLIVLRPRTAQERRSAASVAEGLVGCGYDYEFDKRDEEFYCSELVWVSFRRCCAELFPRQGKIMPSAFAKLPQVYASERLRKK